MKAFLIIIMPMTYCHVSDCIYSNKNLMVFFFIGQEKKKKKVGKLSRFTEYSTSAFNYGVGAINTWALLCSVFHGWLLRKYNSQKLAI